MVEQTRLHEADFLLSILNSVDHEIAVIDKDGAILFVNDAWVRFGVVNSATKEQWLDVNYLEACAPAVRFNHAGVREILEGMRAVLGGAQSRFEHEYPCHSPNEKRWFMMTLSRMAWSPGSTYPNGDLFVVTHTNITERKLMEERVELLSLHDELTGLANRRNFESIFSTEWHRCQRDGLPISLAIFDIDHFKEVNDRYGHLVGDKCIRDVAALIGSFAQRADDLAVRWGGEEFVLLMGNTPREPAVAVAEKVRVLKQHEIDPEYGQCTLSAGVATLIPGDGNRDVLIRMADSALYKAKIQGRNRVVPYGADTYPA